LTVGAKNSAPCGAGRNPRAALTELVLSAELRGVEALAAELQQLRPSELRRRARCQQRMLCCRTDPPEKTRACMH
jgi:hypothetical protein